MTEKDRSTEDQTQGSLRRLALFFGALLKHFDLVVGDARETRHLRQQLAQPLTDDDVQQLLGQLEAQLLEVDKSLEGRRDWEEKTLIYLQHHNEELVSVTAQAAQIIQFCLDAAAGHAQETPENAAADVSTALGSGIDLLRHSDDRLRVLERKLGELLSEVRTRRDLRLKDDQTGVYRPEGFRRRLVELHSRWSRAAAPLSVVTMSIVPRNLDTLTPYARQELSSLVAEELEGKVRVSDVIGIDDQGVFTLLLPDTDVAGASMFAKRTAMTIEASEFDVLGDDLRVTVRCGVTQAREGDAAEHLPQRAGEALQLAIQGELLISQQ